jgi:hypothetical protein
MIKYLTVEVTADDIAKGTTWSNTRCPLALAIQRQTGAVAASVGGTNVYVSSLPAGEPEEETPELWQLPDSATLFIGDFDAGRLVKPSTFELWREVPAEP